MIFIKWGISPFTRFSTNVSIPETMEPDGWPRMES